MTALDSLVVLDFNQFRQSNGFRMSFFSTYRPGQALDRQHL
jgi:hypothetical protein